MIDGWIIAVTMVLQTRLTQFHVWECWMKVFLEKFDMWFKHLLKNQIYTSRQKLFLWLGLNFKISDQHDLYEMFIDNTVLDAKLHLLLFILQWDDTILSLQSSANAKIAIWSFALSSQTFFFVFDDDDVSQFHIIMKVMNAPSYIQTNIHTQTIINKLHATCSSCQFSSLGNLICLFCPFQYIMAWMIV